MRIAVTAIFSVLIGSSSAFAPSANSRGVTLTSLNLANDQSNPNEDDRRSFVSKVSAIALGLMTIPSLFPI